MHVLAWPFMIAYIKLATCLLQSPVQPPPMRVCAGVCERKGVDSCVVLACLLAYSAAYAGEPCEHSRGWRLQRTGRMESFLGHTMLPD